MNFSLQLNRGAAGGNGARKGWVGGIQSMGVSGAGQTGPESNTTVPKRTAETIRATRMREGSICPVLPPIFRRPDSWDEERRIGIRHGYSA